MPSFTNTQIQSAMSVYAADYVYTTKMDWKWLQRVYDLFGKGDILDMCGFTGESLALEYGMLGTSDKIVSIDYGTTVTAEVDGLVVPQQSNTIYANLDTIKADSANSVTIVSNSDLSYTPDNTFSFVYNDVQRYHHFVESLDDIASSYNMSDAAVIAVPLRNQQQALGRLAHILRMGMMGDWQPFLVVNSVMLLSNNIEVARAHAITIRDAATAEGAVIKHQTLGSTPPIIMIEDTQKTVRLRYGLIESGTPDKYVFAEGHELLEDANYVADVMDPLTEFAQSM